MSRSEPERAFEEPWHAEIFALAVGLSEAGVFTWPEWAETFGRHRARDGDYWLDWIAALEEMLKTRGLATPADLDALKAAWRQAYETTPHGQPVLLGEDNRL